VSSLNLIYRPGGFGIAVLLCILAFGACQYEVPITQSPTRKVQEQLLGNWVSLDGKENMRVRRLDDSTYVVYYDGDLFRAYHSDVGDTPFVSVQDLNSNDRKYAYVIWKISNDGKSLRLRSVNDKVISKETKDSAAMVALLTKNAGNPELFGEEIEFRKEK
jgi:lipopolysaccharide export LptBFGC system permease protein LptF